MTDVPVAQVKSKIKVALKLRLINRSILVMHTLRDVLEMRDENYLEYSQCSKDKDSDDTELCSTIHL